VQTRNCWATDSGSSFAWARTTPSAPVSKKPLAARIRCGFGSQLSGPSAFAAGVETNNRSGTTPASAAMSATKD
jgi:hypothetical protein